jgi:hypothetical protein
VALHLEDDASPSPISTTPAFSPGPWMTRGPGGRQGAQPLLGGLVRAVLVPHGREDAELGQVGSRPRSERIFWYSSGFSPCSVRCRTLAPSARPRNGGPLLPEPSPRYSVCISRRGGDENFAALCIKRTKAAKLRLLGGGQHETLAIVGHRWRGPSDRRGLDVPVRRDRYPRRRCRSGRPLVRNCAALWGRPMPTTLPRAE